MKFHDLDLYNIHYPFMEFTNDSNIWCIGDVHGCADEFSELCSKIMEYHPNSVIIQLGDLIDRGEHLKGVFDVVKKYDVKLVIGNHELNFIMENGGYKKCRSRPREKTHAMLSELLPSEQHDILNTIKQSSNLIVCENVDTGENWILSHAPLSNFESGNFKPNAFNCCSRSTPYNDKLIHNCFRAVHGHQHWNYVDLNTQLNDNKQTLNIDSGCVYGNSLVALNISKPNTMLEVKSKKTYFKYV